MNSAARITLKKTLLPFSATVLLLAGCSNGGGGGSTAGTPPSPATPDTRALTIETTLEDGVASGVDALFVYVERSDGAVTTLARGIQDRSTGAAAEPESLFKIASISKLFIATATARLTHQGLIRLDDSIEFWLPDIAPRIANASQVTIRHLVTHRSGVPDFDGQPGFRWEDSHTNIEDTLAFALDKPADFQPDTRYAYSNTNYLLLGKILDTALGYSHRIWIRDFILAPLGMQNTYLVLSEADSSLLARGYWDGRDTTLHDYAIPGGSMVSTLRDTAVFLRALAKGDVMNGEERAIYRELYPFGQSGWLPGYQSIARYETSLDAVVVLFANNTGGNSENVLSATFNEILRLVAP